MQDGKNSVQPRVSVIVPVYNAERFLEERLDSLIHQSLSSLEIICVDDGSTDGSREILERYAARDPRIKVIHQQNQGPAVARNAGIDVACGEFLTSFDADDSCDRELLSTAVACIDAAAEQGRPVDVAIFPESSLHDVLGTRIPLDWAFQTHHFPGSIFSWHDNPGRILNSFQNWLHNKLFRSSFVQEHGLRLQNLRHTEDMLFTCSALMLARSIVTTPANGPRAYYRIGLTGSQIFQGQRYPTHFYHACSALKDFLEQQGFMEDPGLRQGYLNWVGEAVLSNIDLMRGGAQMQQLYDTLHGGGLKQLGLADASPGLFYGEHTHCRLQCLRDCSYSDFLVAEHSALFVRWHFEHERLLALEQEHTCLQHMEREQARHAASLEQRLLAEKNARQALERSRSYRLGRALTALPRALRRFFGLRGR